MTKKKVLAISAVLGIFALVLSAGTLAYFTDRTEAVVNTFTVGKVDIDLTEEEERDWGVDNDGNALMKLMPREEIYAKTPKITVVEGSEDAYVYADIELSNAKDYVRAVANLIANGNETQSDSLVASYESGNFSNETLKNGIISLLTAENGFIKGFDGDKWDIIAFNIVGDKADIIIAHKDKMSAGDSEDIFTGINVPKEMPSYIFNKTNFTNATITITAAAIQAEGFDNYGVAGNALACQWGMASALGITTCE